MLDSLTSITSALQSGSVSTREADRTNPTVVTTAEAAATTEATTTATATQADTIDASPSRPATTTTTTTASGGLPTTSESTTATSASGTDLSSVWSTVFGKTTNADAILAQVAKLQASASSQTVDDRPVTSTTSSSTSSTKVATSRDLPTGTLTANADGSITTPGGYTVVNDGNHQWRIIEPNGQEHRIWGDPHVDENNDGTSDWHFNDDASFILPDGSKIFCDTDKVREYGGEDVTVSNELYIQYQDSLATMDVQNGGAAKLGTGGYAYDVMSGDGEVFVLADDHRFLDAATLGDLYDAGGDFKADVNTSEKGTISENAAIAVAASFGREISVTRNSSSSSSSSSSSNTASGLSLSEMVQNVYANNSKAADLSGDDSGQATRQSTTSKTSAKQTATEAVQLKTIFSAAQQSADPSKVVNGTSGS